FTPTHCIACLSHRLCSQTNRQAMLHQALTIAGSDSSGGAGIQADLKAFSALQVYGAAVITAVTAQNTKTVLAVEHITPSMVLQQTHAVLNDLNIGAIKIGMLAHSATITAVAQRSEERRVGKESITQQATH